MHGTALKLIDLFGVKTILVQCPDCRRETAFSIAALMRKLRPRCRHCRKGITIDRAWLLVEVARLQKYVSG